MGKNIIRAALIVITVLAGAGMAAGQTPDGETPVVETVCEVLRDATPALYGLCVAYCEAMDCTFENFNAEACAPPNPSILANYNSRKQPGDPDMPCIRAECPCFNAEDLQAIEGRSCTDDLGMAGLFDNNYLCPSYATAASTEPLPVEDSCVLTLKQWDGQRCIAVKSFSQDHLSDAEVLACMVLIVEEAARLGLTCS